MARSDKTKQKTLVSSAFNALLSGIGPRKTAQFWHAFMEPNGNYVKERKKIFGRKSVATLAKNAKRYNRKKK